MLRQVRAGGLWHRRERVHHREQQKEAEDRRERVFPDGAIGKRMRSSDAERLLVAALAQRFRV